MIAAIPTLYNRIRFRSRLEARWACFFDLCQWSWEYEPIDFNGWIPDFVLHAHDGSIVYIEVKPVFRIPKDIACEIEKQSDGQNVLILGCSPIWLGKRNNTTKLGWFFPYSFINENVWIEAFFTLGTFCEPDFSFSNSNLNKCTGFLSGHESLGGESFLAIEIAEQYWADACNTTQWKGGVK